MAPGSARKSKEFEAGEPTHKYNVGDVVLAKVRGFPAWPGIIMDDDNVPKAVLGERPATKSRDLYTIRFFPAADYHWASSRDISLLTERQIESFLSDPSKKKGDLRKAYEIAKDPQEWNEQQNQIVGMHEQSLLDAADEQAENEDQLHEEEEEVDDDDDQQQDQDEDQDQEEVDFKANANKKRKRATDAPSTKIRESAQEKRKKQKVAEAAKAKPKAAESAKAPNSGRNGASGEEEHEELDPETKKVKDWRHKLQRAFITKDGVINPEDVPAHDQTFKIVEEYESMTAEQLKVTKIGKVMKRIVNLTDIPRNDEFHFRERAEALCTKWGAIMSGDHPSSSSSKETGPSQDEPTSTENDKPEQDDKPAAAAATVATAEEEKAGKEEKEPESEVKPAAESAPTTDAQPASSQEPAANDKKEEESKEEPKPSTNEA